MLVIVASLAIALLTVVALVEYYLHWRPRVDKTLDNVNGPLTELRGPIVGIAEDVHGVTSAARRVVEAASDRLCRWLEGSAPVAAQRLAGLEHRVAQLGHIQAIEFLKKYRRGFLDLQRYQVQQDRHLLLRARDDLRDGLADITLYFGSVKPLKLLETPEATQALLMAANFAGTAEVYALHALGREPEAEFARNQHAELRLQVADSLESLGDLSRSHLPPSVRAACGGQVGVWRRRLVAAAGDAPVDLN